MKIPDWKKMIRPVLALFLIVIGCGITARFLANGETLSDYAAKQEQVTFEPAAAVPAAESTDTEPKPAADAASDKEEASEKNTEPSHSLSAIAEASAGETAAAGTEDSTSPAGSEGTPAEDAEAGSAPSVPAASAVPAAITEDSDVVSERVTYADGFFYEPIPAAVYRRMIGNSYPEDCPIPLDSLRYLNILYVDFNDQEQRGEIVCATAIAEDLVEIFHDLYEARYQLESVRLVDDYGGDDDLSMYADNTSCFNYRTVAGSTTLSNHARGLAIDINPLYNPWVNHGKVSPPESAEYADRSKDFPHKISKDDLCCQCFTNHGFFWGGNWNNPDYQHFQKN